jgi:Flp pilus assembly protein TadB
MANGQRNEPSIRALVASAAQDAKALAQAQFQLAQAELKQSGQKAGMTAGFFIGAGVLAFLGFIFVLVTLAWVLVALGLPTWAGFGIVALLLLIIAGVLGLLGKRTADKIKGPERAMAEMEKTKAALAGATESAPAPAPAPAVAGSAGPSPAPPAPAAGSPAAPGA